MTVDSKQIIMSDLEDLQSRRRRHFGLALVLAIAVVGTAVALGVRPDLLNQPPLQLVAQAVLWLVCLVLFPAIGVGLWFPRRRTRVALAITGVAAMVVATTGWPRVAHGSGTHGSWAGLDPCIATVLASGVLLLALGILSGAFVQRRRATSVYWVAAGLSLAALDLVTWMCPDRGLKHVLPSHLGGASLLMVLALLVGLWVHRQGRAP